ncbi:putative ABC transport system ATP-binding protein [Rhodoglobus vestalii]|uniref:Putative ABC transport system ATP-binding protein n=1 Tax=Rhodoglobus vestalii TaxID=193384 RepID=A0A8H2K664_9MICO|nr:ATP-binding cassette domain-containing protein [Rhodoglobus vestalii]TQO19649.1 putative ABC transport system ATP-binding protein [Rhodoglobus vestalii]
MTVAISTSDLTFGYGATPLIEGWDQRIDCGELVAITGPSGCGKSTLLYLLGLMLSPTRGEIHIGGSPTSRLKDAQRARFRAERFGFVFQDAALDTTRTVLDNVIETTLYRGESASSKVPDALALLERFGVGLRAAARPGQVSGGQAQRIALCRALLHKPEIVLADEPTGNLDPASAAVVLDAFREHASSGRTVIVVTHDPSVVAKCDRTIHL